MESLDKVNITNSRVAHIFNEMADEYDDLKDVWYSWLFSRLHFIITKKLLCKWDAQPRKVLDVGCGTGFQSFLYALTGAQVIGIDISDKLISFANEKAQRFKKEFPFRLFPSHFEFVDKYSELISVVIKKNFSNTPYIQPQFRVADALQLPFEDNSFDHINCCGSTLSFIEDHNTAIAEMSRVLKHGGTFILEVEAKYNPDIIWTIIDSLVFGCMGYETKLKDALKTAFLGINSHVKVEYPFGDVKNPVYMNIKLFTKSRLKKELKQHDLAVTKTYSIHSVTNLIPSTLLDNASPSRFLIKIFSFLAMIEEYLPISLPGCSLVIIGRKEER